jgi:XTP/dITP diphosphohydrolase
MSGDEGDGERVLRIVTSNEGKAREFSAALSGIPWRVERVASPYEEVQADTLDEVAEASARHLLAEGAVQPPFLLEDAGLFIKGLNGFPGVYSAYVFNTIGCQGILRLMEGNRARDASFESRIALCLPGGSIELLSGTCSGTIVQGERGSGGFGFDPVFIPQGEYRTFAEMSIEEKEGHSHRGQALAALRERLAGL